MLNAFDGHSFRPLGILPTFLVQLGGKTIEVEVEVVDVPLDYNPLLGHNWTYAMIDVVSFVFCIPFFPHEGKIMTIDQLSFAFSSPNASLGQLILVIENYQPTTKNIGVGMYSFLMGTFKFLAPNHQVYAMSSKPISTGRSIPFRTSYVDDLWTLPSLTLSCEGQSHAGMTMPLSTKNITYQYFLDSFADPDPIPSSMEEEDIMFRPVWAITLSCSHDFLDGTSPLDEAIIEAMNGSYKPWVDIHHRSYLLPDLEIIEKHCFRSTLSEIVGHAIVPLDTHEIYAEGNMVSIYPDVQIDISRTPGKVENVNIGENLSPEELLIYTKLFKEF
jgi:hypothetical protein